MLTKCQRDESRENKQQCFQHYNAVQLPVQWNTSSTDIHCTDSIYSIHRKHWCVEVMTLVSEWQTLSMSSRLTQLGRLLRNVSSRTFIELPASLSSSVRHTVQHFQHHYRPLWDTQCNISSITIILCETHTTQHSQHHYHPLWDTHNATFPASLSSSVRHNATFPALLTELRFYVPLDTK